VSFLFVGCQIISFPRIFPEAIRPRLTDLERLSGLRAIHHISILGIVILGTIGYF
jgi:hypothetical protein